MQRHFHDSNLEENKAVLDVIRRRVDAFDNRFVFGEFSEEFERSGCYLPSDKGLHAGYNFALLLATKAGAIRHPSGNARAVSRSLAVHRLFQS